MKQTNDRFNGLLKHVFNIQFVPKGTAFLLLFWIFLFVTACAPQYSPYVYEETASIKSRTLALVNKADQPYYHFTNQVQLLSNDVYSLHQQEKMRKGNRTKLKQWKLMLNEEGHLVAAFFYRWKTDTVLSEPFIKQEARLIGESFDLLQETEKQRLK